ncbi:hypothetical protein [Cytobacillus oceanisediminis]|uniref:hypothetical protein n=1 Tax=Cytobacillus oceanisediminis TaxID=665099 RepID=UPI0011A25525|nr:hypothetical protein [Cytobacillus oceanisediminis]
MNINSKRKELWLFLFSVLILGLEIGILGNILFSEFYANHKVLFISIVTLNIIIIIWIVIRIMFKYDDQQIYSISMIITYDIENKRFIDVPYSPTSVNVRMHYNALSNKNQEKIIEDHKGEVRPSDEMKIFSENAIVQIILSHFIKHSIGYEEKVSRERLKEILVKYKYIDTDDILGGEIFKNGIKSVELTLPKGFKIVPSTTNNIRITSKYGYVNFRMIFKRARKNGKYSKLLLTFENINPQKVLELEYEVELKYSFNPLKVLRRNTDEFNDFIDRVLEGMEVFSVNRTIESFNLEFSPKLIGYLDEKFRELKDKK